MGNSICAKGDVTFIKHPPSGKMLNEGNSIPAKGDFTFIKHSPSREMAKDAYNTITIAEAWELMKEYPGEHGYALNEGSVYDEIIRNLKYRDHTGLTYGWTMIAMHFLAKNGWAAFYKEYCPQN
jgi:hypothetical protein